MNLRTAGKPFLAFLLTCAMLLIASGAAAEPTHGSSQPAQRTGREGTFGVGALRFGVGKRVNTNSQSSTHKMSMTNRFWGVAWMPKQKGDQPRGAALGWTRSSHKITTAPGQTVATNTRVSSIGTYSRYKSTQSGPGAAKTVSHGTTIRGRNTYTATARMTGTQNMTIRSKTFYDRNRNATHITTTTKPANGPAETHTIKYPTSAPAARR